MRDTHTAWTLALALLLIGGCAAPQRDSTAETAEARAGVEATNTQFMAAFSQGDAAGVAACYTEDTQLLPPNGEIVRGRKAVQETMQGFIDAGIKGMQLVSTEVEGHGDTAHEVGTYTLTVENGQTIDEGKYIVIWKKTGDEWKLHRDIFNSNLPLPEPDAPAEAEEM